MSRKECTKWDYEMTDTFGGEANYTWARRGSITTSAKNPVRAVKRALGLENVSCRKENWGDLIALYPVGSCTVVFVGVSYET